MPPSKSSITLTLEVTGPQAAKLAASRKVFRNRGGTIGRLPDNDWVLADPYVSRHHAVIRFADGVYYLEDISSSAANGVFINSADNRLAQGEPYALKNGDSILIEPYEIRVSIEDSAPPSRPYDQFVPGYPPAQSSEPFHQDLYGGEPISVTGDDDVDPFSLLDLKPERAPAPGPNAAGLQRGSPLNEPYRPPSVSPTPSAAGASPAPQIPDDYDPSDPNASHVMPIPNPAPGGGSPQRRNLAPPPPSGGAKNARPTPRPVRSRTNVPPADRAHPGDARSGAPTIEPPRTPTARVAEDSLREVLEGAGLNGVPVTPELARDFGRILRVVVAGTMDILQARQQVKDEFRLPATTFKKEDNNPLKFSANVDDALHNLLVKRNAAYLRPVEAFEDAFDDVRNHQVALLVGLRVAFEAMLAEFDPDRLQAEFDREVRKGALVAVHAKLRYWDLYCQKIRDMVSDVEASFRTLFGEEFADAYEAQLKRLKAQGRSGKS